MCTFGMGWFRRVDIALLDRDYIAMLRFVSFGTRTLSKLDGIGPFDFERFLFSNIRFSKGFIIKTLLYKTYKTSDAMFITKIIEF